MWRELLAVTKFIVRWRVEPTEQALQALAEETGDKRIQRHLAAFELGAMHLQRSVFSLVVSLAGALEQLGVQRKTAAVSLQLYLTAIYTSLIAAVRGRVDTILMAVITMVVSAAALGGVMSIFAAEGLLLFGGAVAAAAALTPFIGMYVPQLGPYPMWPSLFLFAGAAAGALLGGVNGYLAGVALGAVPQTVVWFRHWRRYERELARIDHVIEGAREDVAAGRSVLAQIAREVYEHVKSVGSYDLEIQTRELLLYNARYFAEVRSIAKERALVVAVLLIAAVLTVRLLVDVVFGSQLLSQLRDLPEAPGVEAMRLAPPDVSMIGWFVPLAAALVGRMFDSYAAAAPSAAALSVATLLILNQ